MEIAIVGRHTKVSEEFRERIAEKLDKVESLDPKATRIDVQVVHERNARRVEERERVELTVRSRGPVIRAEATAADRTEALDAAALRLVERLRKQHERKISRHRGKGVSRVNPAPDVFVELEATEPEVVSVEAWEGAPDDHTREIPLAGTPIVIRSKIHEGAPMSISEAIDQMELVGHDFYLFHDAETGLPSAVYRRRGWTYGVIHLDAAPAKPTAIDTEDGELRASA